MRASALKYTILSVLATVTMVIMVLIPFHAFLTVWGSSLVGHYTALRLWKELLLIVSVLGVGYLLLSDTKIRTHTLSRRLVWLIIGYIGINNIWGLVAYHQHGVSLKALGYAWIIDLRYLIFFMVTWTIALRSSRLHARWLRLVLWPAAIVIGFSLLQIFVLPYDFLRHFGYDLNTTIAPFETVNHNLQFIRVMSTLRGANPFGAYLLIPISVLTVLMVRGQRRWQEIGLMVGAVISLYFTYSRSAWLGAVLAVGVILVLSLRSRIAKQRAIAIVGVGFILLTVLAVGFQNNSHVENVLFHTQTNSAIKTTSDQGHASALRSGIQDLLAHPLGSGPGSAGPASVYNNHQVRIAENYYVQIGQELGWIGLGFFLLINVAVGYLLWLGRANRLALSLFASLIGLTLINCLSHAWADDTLAYLWWGLAGIAMVEANGQGPKFIAKARKVKPGLSKSKP